MIFFRLLFNYVRLIHDHIYYKRVHYLGREKLPPAGSPLLIVGNHQNAINDPLALEFCFADRDFHIFARGGLFASRFGNFFFRGLKVLPAYRLRTDGEDSLSKNAGSFAEATDVLLGGGSVGIFPEATNQDKHWLGDFSQAYLRLAFDAAAKADFKTEIYVQPVATHYSDYFKFRADMMIECGEPVALSPYYEAYRSKPRTTCRRLNEQIRSAVSSLMLDVRDLDDYEAIDYLRESYGIRFARELGLDPRSLPEKLKADRELVSRLEALKESDPAAAAEIFSETLELKRLTLEAGLKDRVFDDCPSSRQLAIQAAALVVLFPLFVFALYPNVLAYLAPRPAVEKYRKMGGPFVMFQGGVQLGLNALLIVPLAYLIVFIIDILLIGIFPALVHLALLAPLGLFAWRYSRDFKRIRGYFRFRRGRFGEIGELRERLVGKIKELGARD